MENQGIQTRGASATEVSTFVGGSGVPSPLETGGSALAARAEATIRAAYTKAMMNPRDINVTRSRLLQAAARPGFAAAAKYRLPRRRWDPEKHEHVNEIIEGPSVRFAEEVERDLGNILRGAVVTFEDQYKRIGEVNVVELERNLVLSGPFVVDKTMERRELRKGEIALDKRVGSEGQTVYILPAYESELRARMEAAISRVRRNLVVQLLPADILDEAIEACEQTLEDEAAKDPEVAKQRIRKALQGTGVKPADIRAWLGGKPFEHASIDELRELEQVALAVREGETTWAKAMEERQAAAPSPADEGRDRAELLAEAARIRIASPAVYTTVMMQGGYASDVDLKAIEVATLRNIVAALKIPQAADEKKPAGKGKG